MNTCQWCGDRHGVDQLCQRAQRGLTRRSFCFLFGAGVAGALVAGAAPENYWYLDRTGVYRAFTVEDIARAFHVPPSMIVSVYDGYNPTWYPDDPGDLTFPATR